MKAPLSVSIIDFLFPSRSPASPYVAARAAQAEQTMPAAIIELAIITARKYPFLVGTSQLIRSHSIRIPGKFISGVAGSR